jgi:hypothetical protein
MTDLTKAVCRRSRSTFAHYRRRIVIILEPGDLLAMRLERSRTTYRAPFDKVFRQLADWYAQAESRRKREERKARGGGR